MKKTKKYEGLDIYTINVCIEVLRDLQEDNEGDYIEAVLDSNTIRMNKLTHKSEAFWDCINAIGSLREEDM